jgi:drug/metabolite transporter (DMT)-like permease
MFISAIALAVLSNVFYHIVQKVTPQQVNPVLSLAVSYLAAAVICLVLLPVFPLKHSLRDSLGQLNWATLGLALAIVGVEIGFLLAYRSGWDISLAGLVSNAAVAVVLLPFGLLLFNEKLTLVNIVGVLVCVVGLVLVNWKN